MELKGIIFDLDGVITDTAEYHYIAWKEIAAQLGHNLTEEQNEKIKGLSRLKSLMIILDEFNIQKNDEEIRVLTEQKNKHYQTFLKNLTAEDTLPGVDSFLTSCKEKGIKVAIGSASKNTKRILKELNLSEFFDAVVDGNMVNDSKPAPEVFLKAAKKMNLKPDEVVVFEDAIAGVEAANAGGFFSVGVGDSKKLNHANHVISSLVGFTLHDLILLTKKQNNHA